MNNFKSILQTSRILLVLMLLVLFAGCSDDDDKGSTGEPGSLERLWSHSVISGCGLSCHGPNGLQSQGPDLTTKASFRNSLVNTNYNKYKDKDKWVVTNPCPGTYIVPNSVKSSSILSIVSNHNGGNCGSFNVHTDTEVTGTALLDLIEWIENGAPAN